MFYLNLVKHVIAYKQLGYNLWLHYAFYVPFFLTTQDSYPAHVSLHFGSTDDEHKPLIRVNDPEPSLCSNDVIAERMRKESRKKKRVHFSETDDHPLPLVRGSLLPSKDYDVCLTC